MAAKVAAEPKRMQIMFPQAVRLALHNAAHAERERGIQAARQFLQRMEQEKAIADERLKAIHEFLAIPIGHPVSVDIDKGPDKQGMATVEWEVPANVTP